MLYAEKLFNRGNDFAKAPGWCYSNGGQVVKGEMSLALQPNPDKPELNI